MLTVQDIRNGDNVLSLSVWNDRKYHAIKCYRVLATQLDSIFGNLCANFKSHERNMFQSNHPSCKCVFMASLNISRIKCVSEQFARFLVHKSFVPIWFHFRWKSMRLFKLYVSPKGQLIAKRNVLTCRNQTQRLQCRLCRKWATFSRVVLTQ